MLSARHMVLIKQGRRGVAVRTVQGASGHSEPEKNVEIMIVPQSHASQTFKTMTPRKDIEFIMIQHLNTYADI